MKRIDVLKDFSNLEENNKIIFENNDYANIEMNNTEILFKGKNNILYIEDGVKISNSKIVFEADNNVVYLCKSNYSYLLNLTLYRNSAFYCGEGNYFNGILNVILSERKHVFIGDNGLFSFGIWLRIADPHLIYDCNTMQRKNPSKSIFIGDHVWIGQGAMVLKGTHIGSGSIVGAMSVVSNKKIPSNTAYAGNPAKQVSENIFYDKQSVHNFTKKRTKESLKYSNDDFIYKCDEHSLSFSEIDKSLDNAKTANDKLELLHKIRNNSYKNRFATKKVKKHKKFKLF